MALSRLMLRMLFKFRRDRWAANLATSSKNRFLTAGCHCRTCILRVALALPVPMHSEGATGFASANAGSIESTRWRAMDQRQVGLLLPWRFIQVITG
jgi:hypothetical protein